MFQSCVSRILATRALEKENTLRSKQVCPAGGVIFNEQCEVDSFGAMVVCILTMQDLMRNEADALVWR